jgi:phosphoenolpyruvate synthase/pyruvate phosphate dikinase
MAFVVTLRTAVQGDVHRIGRRAMDLVILFEKNIQIPLSFIITADALRAVYAKNDLGNLLAKAQPEEYEDILLRCTLPDDLTEELVEGYESLAIKDDISAHHLMSASEMGDVLLIPSPTKVTNELSGILHALQGKDDFLQKVKAVWANLLKTQAGSLDAGIIVQKMVEEDVAGIALIGHDDVIAIKTYYGLQNFHEVPQCDEFEVSKSLLSIGHAEVSHQDAKLIREEDGIEEYPLKERGSHQKASDKEVIEIARIAKRSQSFLHKNLAAYMGFKRLRLYLLFCDDAPFEDAPEEAASEAIVIEKAKPAEIEITLGETIGKGFAEEKKIDLVVADEAFTYEAPQAPMQEESEEKEARNIAYDADLQKPIAEQETDDFMLSMPIAHLVQEEVKADPVQEVKAEPADILNASRLELNHLVSNAELALKEALIDVLDLNKISHPAEDSIIALAMQAKQAMDINTEDVAKIASIAKRAQDEHVSLEELMFVIDTCERMVREAE